MQFPTSFFLALLSLGTVPATATTQTSGILPLKELVAEARTTYPDLHIKYIQPPEHADDTVIVRGNRSGSLFRDNVNAVYLNPYSGETVASHSPSKVSALHALVALVTPLHFGNFGGLVSKLVWFSYGCLLCLMIGSGFFIWSKRTFNTARRRSRQGNSRGWVEAGNRRRSGVMAPIKWRGFAWLSWLLALLPIYFFYW